MDYKKLSPADLFSRVNSESAARLWFWYAKSGDREFCCPHCKSEAYYQYKSRPEIRKCQGCRKQIRLRAGTMLANSKIRMLDWFRALFLMMQDKRGVSALHVQRQLGLKSYGTRRCQKICVIERVG